jgi:hypothetical protein
MRIVESCSLALMCVLVASGLGRAKADGIVHDAEYYILKEQNGERWQAEDEAIEKRLAEFRENNGGKSPNIFYVLIDDIGIGDNNYDDRFTLDRWLRTDASAMVTGSKAREEKTCTKCI